MVKRVVSPQIPRDTATHLVAGAIRAHNEGRAEGPKDKVAMVLIRRECIISAPIVSTRAASAEISGFTTMVYNVGQRDSAKTLRL